MFKFLVGITFIFSLLFFSCTPGQKEKEINSNPLLKKYLHLSHTRTNTNPKLDSVVEQINFNNYDMLWLGGDLAQLTSADDTTMEHVDSIFNLSNKSTLWSLGNHDYTNPERIKKFTKRPSYYSIHQNGITIVVLDTQDSLSNIIGEQKDFLFEVLDTLKQSSHLIILHHKLIWMYDRAKLESRVS